MDQRVATLLLNSSNYLQALTRWAQKDPDREGIVFLDVAGNSQSTSYGQIYRDALGCAAHYDAHGLQPGQPLILVFPHSYDLLIAFLGAMFARAIPTILPYPAIYKNSSSYRRRIEYLAQWTSAGAVVTSAELQANFLATTTLPLEKIITFSPAHLQVGDNLAFNPIDPQPEDITHIQFSSGTTGNPKGVMISHRALINYIASAAIYPPYSETIVSWLPLFHDLGLVTCALMPLSIGGRVVSMPPQVWVRNPAHLFKAVSEYAGTVCWMPNFGFAHSLRRINDQDIEGVDLSSLQVLGSGGEPIQAKTIRSFYKRFTKYGLKETSFHPGYGMAENVVAISVNPLFQPYRVDTIVDHGSNRSEGTRPNSEAPAPGQEIVSSGMAHNKTEIRIMDQYDQPLSNGQIGEIVTRGTYLFSGYYRQPELTAQVMRGGWLHTGDSGYLKDGYLYVVGRLKDLIIVGGRNIYPHFIEKIGLDVLGKVGRRAAAFGVRDETLGTELPVLVCELGPKIDQDEHTDLANQIRTRVHEELDVLLADIRFMPRGTVVITTSGKIARAATQKNYQLAGFKPAIREIWANPAETPQSAAEIEAYLMPIFASVCGEKKLDPATSFFDQGIDSLALVQILLVIEEQFETSIAIEKLVSNPTIIYLAQLLSGDEAQPHARLEEVSAPNPSDTTQKTNGRLHSPLYKKAFIAGPTFRRRELPYQTGTRLQRAWVKNKSIQEKFFFKEIDTLLKCTSSIAPDKDPQAIIQQSLMNNLWYIWRLRALKTPADQARWVTINGADILEKIAASGQGIVLAMLHTRLKRLLSRLPPLHRREVTVIGNIRPHELQKTGLPNLAHAVNNGAEISRTGLRSAQIYQAQQILKRGGICIILADDIEGTGGWRIPFHGRLRPFRPGTAELALRTNAIIVPTFATMDVSGHVIFDFLQPLRSNTAEDSGTQIEDLTRQYAAVLQERWVTDLGSLEWKMLAKHLQFPEI